MTQTPTTSVTAMATLANAAARAFAWDVFSGARFFGRAPGILSPQSPAPLH